MSGNIPQSDASEIALNRAKQTLQAHAPALRRLCGGRNDYERHELYPVVVRHVANGGDPAQVIRTIGINLAGL